MKESDSLPTRTGVATGDANERQMLENLRDVDGCETRARTHYPSMGETLLRSRAGMPRFITLAPGKDAGIAARGFLVRANANAYSAIFDPYSLEIEIERYKPASPAYYVSGVQASPYDPRKWLDVWSWDGATVRINGQPARSFSPLRFPSDVPGALPYIIPWPTIPIYGSRHSNAPYPKRIFAVGAVSVGIATSTTYGADEIPAEALYPPGPRDANKALVCGQAVDAAAACLSQFYFTGATWDALGGAWAYSSTRIAMLLTPPYLEREDVPATVDMPVVSLGTPVSTSNNYTERPVMLPTTEIAAFGIGEAYATTEYTYDPGGSSGRYEVVFPWRGVVSAPLPGRYEAYYSRTAHSGSATLTQEQGGVEIVYSGSNVKNYESHNAGFAEVAAVIDYTGQTASLGWLSAALDADSGSLFWADPSQEPGALPNIVGRTAYYNTEKAFGSNHFRDYETQNGLFTVTADGKEIVRVQFFREKSSGEKPIITPWLGYYSDLLANPYANLHTNQGMGIMCGPVVLTYKWIPGGNDIVPIRNYYKVVNGVQDPAAVGEINTKYRELRDALVGKVMYDDETSYAVYRKHYNWQKVPNVNEDQKTLSWSTRDFILHDQTNGVYISVDGHFEGEQGISGEASVTLSVTLRIETPGYDESKTLSEFSMTYANLLPEAAIWTGKTGIPSPQIRAIFAPKSRDQGTFPGAAYVTAAEVANGAAPALVVSFLLSLETYAFVGAAPPTDRAIHFVPCNLLEMLYAYVYSQKYGIDPTSRYPVTNTSAYNTIMEELFLTTHVIRFRDGSFTDWVANFGEPYYGDQKTELYRA